MTTKHSLPPTGTYAHSSGEVIADVVELGAVSLFAMEAMVAELDDTSVAARQARDELSAAITLVRSAVERIGAQSTGGPLSNQLAHGFVTRLRRS